MSDPTRKEMRETLEYLALRCTRDRQFMSETFVKIDKRQAEMLAYMAEKLKDAETKEAAK